MNDQNLEQMFEEMMLEIELGIVSEPKPIMPKIEPLSEDQKRKAEAFRSEGRSWGFIAQNLNVELHRLVSSCSC